MFAAGTWLFVPLMTALATALLSADAGAQSPVDATAQSSVDATAQGPVDATAQDPVAPEALAAFAEKEKAIPADLRRDYYATVANEPGSTEHGGAYQYFAGALGDGAIYWSEQTGAHLMYGAILLHFERSGREHVYGYPIEDVQPGDPQSVCAPDTVATQHFVWPTKPGGAVPRPLPLCPTVKGSVYRAWSIDFPDGSINRALASAA